MWQLSLFLLLNIFEFSISNTIEGLGTVIYDGSVTLTCGDNTDGVFRWEPVDGSKTQNKFVVSGLQQETTFTCYRNEVKIAEKTVYVANIAGSSNSLCKTQCDVSCTLTDIPASPLSVRWSGSSLVEDLSEGNTETTHTDSGSILFSYQKSLFDYETQETSLRISNLAQSSYFTCSFEFSDGAVITSTVSALVRNSEPCDIVECKTIDQCQSMDIISDSACQEDCKKCFAYEYVIGEFIDSGRCKEDTAWCLEYLDNRGKCGDNKDSIVKYCSECGHCQDFEFRPSKLVLPLAIFITLCGLTVLMCYKSYEEKRSVLPKVHITRTEPTASTSGTKFVPQVSVGAERSTSREEMFKLKVRTKGAVHSNEATSPTPNSYSPTI